jgi:hypothetical protein
MGLTIDDLKPKNFKINIRGIELECKPLRLSHTMVIAKVGEVFKDATKATTEQILEAEKSMDEVIGQLIPEIKGIELDTADVLAIIEAMMDTITPEDNSYLEKKGVTFDTDPKAEKNG